MKQKVETLQADLSRRQESYIRRERAFNMRIEELEEEVGSLKVRCARQDRIRRRCPQRPSCHEQPAAGAL